MSEFKVVPIYTGTSCVWNLYRRRRFLFFSLWSCVDWWITYEEAQRIIKHLSTKPTIVRNA